jgi:Spy/CpxP family protein refolding chaperone
MKKFAAILLILWASGEALAQGSQPYAGMQNREIKALSTDQIADLKAGRGMGLALAAELNGMPGPSHVLQIGEKLGLTEEQRARVQRLFEDMKLEAVPIGEKLLSQEAALDREFATKQVTPASLKKATTEIGATQGELRNAHLKYHLATLEVLTPAQTARYAGLRGYTDQGKSHQHPPH